MKLLSFSITALLYFLLIVNLSIQETQAFGLKNIYKNLHINNTSPGNYKDAASGWYSGGSSVIRTKNTAISPISISAPSVSSGCNGIDAFAGSFSMISGGELVSMVENIGSQAPVYGLHLGMKTYAPQIEQTLKDLRNLQMELNQFGISHCKATQSAFAAILPQNTAMYETVCNEMASSSGADLGEQRKKCRDFQAQKKAANKAQERDPDLLMDNYNLFIKAANSAGIPKALHPALMSMTGTIIVKDGIMIPYPSLAKDMTSWNTHINGGSGASMYECNNSACLNITVKNNVEISYLDAYSGKAKYKLDEIKLKMLAQSSELTKGEQGFIDSLGSTFPIFDHITLEAVSGISILDSSSQIVARYMLLQHLESTTNDIRKAIISLKQKQINDQYLIEYEKSLSELLSFAKHQWSSVMSDADRINERAEKIERHLIARERG